MSIQRHSVNPMNVKSNDVPFQLYPAEVKKQLLRYFYICCCMPSTKFLKKAIQ